ncbi:MAG TPA: hypothetical protein VHS56_13315 [Candidatus Cybelea sp.]|nr:hypothetical protein [Candidatus Cybelea sp.]
MNPLEPALAVANAVLYEGYILFPYTASAKKNRIRWQFGVVVPQAYAALGSGEPSVSQTEVLLQAGNGTRVTVVVRFLQVETRWIQVRAGPEFETVESVEIDGRRYVSFDEGIEREIEVPVDPFGPPTAAPIAFADEERVEPLGEAAARVVRRRWPLHGSVTVKCEPVAGDRQLRKLRVCVANQSAVVPGERSSALRTAFVSTHTLLYAEGGRFLSVLDPPPEAQLETPALRNRHTWPVLVGDETADAQRSPLVLSSPIILYDFPAVAPQSQGDTFDATEIDELMMLSVRSLSDAEREEARATDPRARAIVDRAERFGAQELTDLHGVLDIPSMDCVFVKGEKIAKGSIVRLHPKRRADVWDEFLEGKTATVRAIHQDVENQMYVAVTVDDDPASDLHDWYGRSLFFYPDEVEPVSMVSERSS